MTLAAFTLEALKGKLLSPLVWFGFAAQFVFFLRFFVQWVASERRGRSHVPVSFWWLSTVGGFMLMVYAALQMDIVIFTGQALSLVIYARNLILIYERRARAVRIMGDRGAAAELGESAA